MMVLVRMLRLMRMLRLLRLLKAVRPLYHLAVGIMKALVSMFWVLVLTMVALYACALLATNLIGHAMIPDAEKIEPETRALFGTVPDSLFTLFGLMNKQFWDEVSPMFEVLPWAKPVWVMFTILSSWALLSVMTGVVSDNMLEVRQAQEQKDSEAFEEFRERLLRVLTEVFTAADKDGNGSLEREEYTDILSSPFHVRRLQRLANVPIQDMISMFDWIDVDEGGSISFEDFVNGFDWLNEAVTGKALLKLESAVRQRCCTLERQIDSVKERFTMAQDLAKSHMEEAKGALIEAKERLEAEAEQRRAEAEQLEAQARATREEAQRLRRSVATANACNSGPMFDSTDKTARASPMSPAGASQRGPAPVSPPVEARTIAAIAQRLRSSLTPPPMSNWHTLSPLSRARAPRAPRWLEEEVQEEERSKSPGKH